MKWVAIPNRSTRSPERKTKEKSRWFKKAPLAYWMRGPDQRDEAAAWMQSLPPSRGGRTESPILRWKVASSRRRRLSCRGISGSWKPRFRAILYREPWTRARHRRSRGLS